MVHHLCSSLIFACHRRSLPLCRRSILDVVDLCLFVADLSSLSSISASSSIFASLSLIYLRFTNIWLSLFHADLWLSLSHANLSTIFRSISDSPIYDYLSLTIWAYFGGFVIWFWMVGLWFGFGWVWFVVGRRWWVFVWWFFAVD